MGFTQKMLDAINNARNSMISGIQSPNPMTGAIGMGGGGTIANSAGVYAVDPSLLANSARREATGPDMIFSANVQVHKVSNGYTVKFDHAQRSEVYIASELAQVHSILVSHMTAQRLES